MNETQNQSAKNETIKTLVDRLTTDDETDEQKIENIYYFVRDEIQFGWMYPQEIPAAEVLKTKADNGSVEK
jgi:hypothetical protein